MGDSGRLRRFFSQGFALLVLSIRRGSKLATAMEARGFGAAGMRTYARVSTIGWREAVLVALAVAVAATAVIVSVSTGSWNFIGSQS